MATKNFMTLENLTTYDGLIKQYIAEGDAESIKAVALDNNILKFYDVETPTVQTQPKYSIELPSAEGFIPLIEDAAGDKIVVSNSDGSVSESEIAIDDVVTNGGNSFTGDKVAITGSDGSISESDWGIGNAGDPAIMTGYVANVDSASGYLIVSADPDDEYDITGADIKVEDLVTGGGSEGYLAVWNDGNVLGNDDISVAAVNSVLQATDGFDGTNTIAGFIGSIPAGSSATTVIGYVDEVAGSITTASDVTLIEAQTPTTGYLKTYELYQGGNTVANLVGKIDIPKDLVVTSGEIVVNPTGQPAGTYLKLTIANQTTPVYINVADLCDAYTAASGATQVQLAISNTNEISATLVNGAVDTAQLANSAVTEGKIANSSVTTAKINNGAVTTDKIADDAVTADKIRYSAVTEDKIAEGAVTSGKISLNEYTVSDETGYVEADEYAFTISVTTENGQVSDVNADLDMAKLYSAIDGNVAIDISNAIEALDATVSKSAGADGLALQVVEADGVLTSVTGSIAANTYDAYGAASTAQSTVIGTSGDAASANTINGAKAYADAATAAIATADINALFNSNSNS